MNERTKEYLVWVGIVFIGVLSYAVLSYVKTYSSSIEPGTFRSFSVSGEGKVVAVGPGKILENGKRQALEIKKGDKVLFTKYGPHEIKIENKEYLIAKEEDVLAILG